MPWIAGNFALNQSQMENNAVLLRQIFLGYHTGWTLQAISALLGNMQSESTINPGLWENYQPYWRGYGLVQWTPYTNYSDWAGAGWENNGPKQCDRIEYERLNNLEWIINPNYPYTYTFDTWHESTDSPTDLARAFLVDYERPIASVIPSELIIRGQQAEDWYTYLSGHPYVPTPQLKPWMYAQFDKWRRVYK